MPFGSPVVRFASLLALGLLFGCSGKTPDNRAADEAAIRALDADWSNTAGAHNLDGIVSYYSDDAIVLAPNTPIATTKDAIRASWAPLAAPNANISWQSSKVDVSQSGDLGYSSGTYDLSMPGPDGKPTADKGKFVEVWKKQPDGKWKVVADIYNSDLPAQP